MDVIGALIGLAGFTGALGAAAGALIAAVILRRAQHPTRAARIAAWSWAAILAVGGLVLAVAAVRFSPPDALNVAVGAMFVWMGAVNAVSGAVTIDEVVKSRRREAPARR